MSPKRPASDTSFESALKRLEGIVDQLERGDLTLDDSLRMYEEGLRLSKECVDALMKAELRLKRLSKDMQGKFRLVDEEPGSDTEADDQAS